MPQINTFKQTWLMFANELKRYIFSKRIFILFFIFAGILFLFSFAAITFPQKIMNDVVKSANVPQQEMAQLQQSFSAAKNHSNPVVRHLFSIPPVNLLVFTLSWVFLPLIIFIMGYNAISGEIAEKNIQYYLMRVSRGAFFFGKLLATTAAIFVIVLAANFTVLLYAKSKLMTADFLTVMKYMLHFDGYLIIFSFCYIGYIFLLSCLIDRPPIVLLMAFVIPIFASFLRFAGLEFLLPSNYIRFFYMPEQGSVLKALGAYCAFGGVYISLAYYVFGRKDVG